MWMKSVPYSTFSDFKPKNGTAFRDRKLVSSEFEHVPNYKLTSKAFDVRHLDRFITRINSDVPTNMLNRDSMEVSTK